MQLYRQNVLRNEENFKIKAKILKMFTIRVETRGNQGIFFDDYRGKRASHFGFFDDIVY